MNRNTKKQPDSPLRAPLSAKATLVIVGGLVLTVGAIALGSRALARGNAVAATPREVPRVVKEQVTGEFDASAVTRALPGEETQEGALRRERLEAIRNQTPGVAGQMP